MTEEEAQRYCDVRVYLRKVIESALAYDAAIRACANDPARITQYQTAQGDDLDALYADWLNAAHMAQGYLDATLFIKKS